MRIKKNGKVINLTESDIKKLSKRILKEQVSPEELINNLREMGDLQKKVAHSLKSKTPKDWWDIWGALAWLGDWNDITTLPYKEWNNKAGKAAAKLDLSLDETEGSDFWRNNEKISKSLGPEYVKLLNAIEKMWDKLLMDIHFVPLKDPRQYNEKPLSYLLKNPPSKRISGDNYTDKIPNDIRQLKDLLVKLEKLDFENTKQYKEANATFKDKVIQQNPNFNEHNIRIKKNGKVINLTESDIKKLNKSLLKEDAPPTAPEGKGCAKSEGGSGCIKTGKYVDTDGDEYPMFIINNKHGGVFKGCTSDKDCEGILSVPAVHKG